MTRPLLLAIAATFVLAPLAQADPLLPAGWTPVRPEGFAMSVGLPALPLARPSDPLAEDAAGAVPEAAAPATDSRRLGVFANGLQLSFPSDGVGTDLRGGAYLRLLRNLSLRGSYRVFDYDRVESDGTLDTDDHGPLFGLNLQF